MAAESANMAESVPLDVLASKFEDDEPEGEAHVAAGTTSATLSEEGKGKTESEQPQNTEHENQRDSYQYDDGDYYDEYYGEDEEEEDEAGEDSIMDALDWLDIQEDGAPGGRLTSFQGMGRRPNAHGGNNKKLQPISKQAHKLEGKVYTGKKVSGPSISSTTANALKQAERDSYLHGPGKSKDRADRATVEQALDPRTRMVLFKMLNRGLFNEIHGCVSTGKEANVYHAVGPEGNDMAVKVFKTSILVFRDRDRYVTGDWRFRRGYCKSNPRKMVKLWAEKETRNLIRLAAAGIPCPTPIQLRLHVLVMSFIGRDGYAAPRLKVRRVSARCSLLSSLPYYDDFTDFTTLSPSSFAARMQTYPRPSVERFTESS